MTDLQLLCLRMADELDHYRQLLSDDRREVHCLAVEARAAVAAAADGPAVPAGREPAAVAGEPSDMEMLELMPKIMLEEFSHAAQVCSDATGGQVKPGIFRVCLNTAALEYAKAVLARWGQPTAPPAVTTRALLHPAYEPGDGSADGAQMVELEWWHSVMGCDSLQVVVDNARAILGSRWGQPAATPAPEVGEVGELVEWLEETGHLAMQADGEEGERYFRVAALLQQLAAAAPVVVPVPVAVTERLPGPSDCDAEGFCWFWSPEDLCWFWERIDSGFCRRYGAEFDWLPARALPLPSGEVEG